MFFSFRQYGGVRKALDAAILERHIRLYTTGELYALERKLKRRQRAMRNSSTGIIGVEFYIDPRYDDHGQWRAIGSEDGKHHRRSFAVLKHGENGAFRQACKERFDYMGPLQVVGGREALAALPCTLRVPYYLGDKLIK